MSSGCFIKTLTEEFSAIYARFPQLTHVLIGFHLPFVAFLRL